MSQSTADTKALELYREEFPITKNRVYLDHAGVGPISLSVKRALDEFTSSALNSAMFSYTEWTDRIEKVRSSCAGLINSKPEELAFLKNTSHGLSIVAEGLNWKEGDNLLMCEREFPSNIYPWLNLKRKGVEVRVVPSRNGRILLEDIERLIDKRTKLFAISSVQYWNGFRIDLKRVGELCKAKKVLFCVDAIQSLGVVPFDVKQMNIDFLAADGHKWLLAPEGIAIFYCRSELAEQVHPLLVGWKSIKNELDYDHIEFDLKKNALKFEEGSMNTMGIYALGAAVELILEAGGERVENAVLDLGDFIIEEAVRRGFEVRTPRSREERAGIISFLGDFEPLSVKDKLKELGIMVNVRGGGIRVSPHFYNNKEDISRLFEGIDKVLGSKR